LERVEGVGVADLESTRPILDLRCSGELPGPSSALLFDVAFLGVRRILRLLAMRLIVPFPLPVCPLDVEEASVGGEFLCFVNGKINLLGAECVSPSIVAIPWTLQVVGKFEMVEVGMVMDCFFTISLSDPNNLKIEHKMYASDRVWSQCIEEIIRS
jgi:hypothetical protein